MTDATDTDDEAPMKLPPVPRAKKVADDEDEKKKDRRRGRKAKKTILEEYGEEREKVLEPSVFLRFGLCGALCNAVAEGAMLPIYASKTLAQADPEGYPEGLGGVKRIVDEDLAAAKPALATSGRTLSTR